jgi:23S rRNA (guanosine2251-2'-O)-methyltransferase
MQYKKRMNKKMLASGQQPHEVVYGAHAITEFLRAKKRKLMSLYRLKSSTKTYERIARYLPKSIPNMQYVDAKVLERMAGTTEHGGVVLLVAPFMYAKKMFDPQKHPFILLLDAVQDVRNLGAILRSAYCTGVTGVVICRRDAAPITPTVLKMSAGLAENLQIYRAPSIKAAITELKTAGYNLYMAVLEKGTNAMDVEYQGPKCLVIGNEATGISRDVHKDGTLITLPQTRPDISYNASVAAGILLFVLSQSQSS